MVQSSLGFFSGRTGDDDKAIPYGTSRTGPEGSSESFYLNSSTLSKGLAAHGRKRLRVNLVFSPGFTFTSR